MTMDQSKKWVEQANEASSQEIPKALFEARDAMLNIRSHMKLMGMAARILTLKLQNTL
ncbi:putative phosphomevalonate kinase [Helianthus annuus]|uniref:Phosphomevalonate kinase n=1 Tax=Helianthus annuus TaxID=4232 RepID=A0A251S0H2_HELAN|nr:putative phosphomevalonate kinase [Helianthus annuus]